MVFLLILKSISYGQGYSEITDRMGFSPCFLELSLYYKDQQIFKKKEEMNMAVKKLTKNSARRNNLPLSSGGFMKWIFQNDLM